MKKLAMLIILFSSFILATGCDSKSEVTYLEEISFDKLYEMLDNEESFILEFIQDGCTHCAVFTPRFKNVLEDYQIYAKQLNFSNITQEEYSQIVSDFGTFGTPTVIFIENGKEKTTINRLTGEPSEKEIIRKLTQNGYIEE